MIILLVISTSCTEYRVTAKNNNPEDGLERPSPSGSSTIDKEVEFLSPIDVSDDPIKREVLEFNKNFLSSLSFPQVGGFPVSADKDSFKLVKFVPQGDIYITITQFRIRTMEGPKNKQFIIHVKDNGNSVYSPEYVQEDK